MCMLICMAASRVASMRSASRAGSLRVLLHVSIRNPLPTQSFRTLKTQTCGLRHGVVARLPPLCLGARFVGIRMAQWVRSRKSVNLECYCEDCGFLACWVPEQRPRDRHLPGVGSIAADQPGQRALVRRNPRHSPATLPPAAMTVRSGRISAAATRPPLSQASS